MLFVCGLMFGANFINLQNCRARKFACQLRLIFIITQKISSRFIPKFHGGAATCHNKHKDATACSVLLSALVVFILTHPLCHYLGVYLSPTSLQLSLIT